MAEPTAGQRIGTYVLERELGRGGFGGVWQARADDGHVAALKLLNEADSDALRRFRREAEILRTLNHPNCLRFLSFDVADGLPHLVTELLDGVELTRWRAHSFEDKVHVALQVARALEYAHSHGIIHRDLKPSNVMVLTNSGSPTVKVLDFGIARLFREPQDITKTGEVIGTPGFMSPEQLRGRKDIGPATDQYCLGVLMFELFTGRRPYEENTSLAIAMAQLTKEVPSASTGHPWLDHIIARLMQKEPGARFAAMSAVVAALEHKGAAVRAPIRPQQQTDATSRRRLAMFTLATAVTVGIMLVIASNMGVSERGSREAKPRPLPVAKRADSPVAARDRQNDELVVDADVDELPDRCTGLRPGFDERVLGSQRPVLSYVPTNFAPERHPWLIVLFRGGGKDATESGFFEKTGIRAIADSRNAVVLIPRAKMLIPFIGKPTGHSWLTSYKGSGKSETLAVRRALDDIVAAQSHFCLQNAPVFAIGENIGARAIDWIVTQAPDLFAGAAVFDHRLGTHDEHGDDESFAPTQPVPYLHFEPMLAPRHGTRGGRCPSTGDIARWPLERHRNIWLEAHGCKGTRVPTVDYGTDACFRYHCEVPYETCEIQGGTPWTRDDVDECSGPHAAFDRLGVVTGFFDRTAEQRVDALQQSRPDVGP